MAGEDEDAAVLPDGLEDLFPALMLPEGTGLPVLAWIRDVLEREHGLPPPPVPQELVERVRALGPGLVTTRKDELGPYELGFFLDELAAGSPEPYLLLGIAGHGIDAWAMHYYLIGAHLGLFIQLRFGGAYGDLERERARVTNTFAVAEDFVLAPGLDRLAEGQRLVVVESDLVGRQWGVIGPGCAGLKAADDPLGDALAWLDEAADPAAAGGLAEARPWPIWG